MFHTKPIGCQEIYGAPLRAVKMILSHSTKFRWNLNLSRRGGWRVQIVGSFKSVHDPGTNGT